MEIRRLNPGDCVKAMGEWINMFPQLPQVDNEYGIIRDDITTLFESVKTEAEESGHRLQDYFVDWQFGIQLYTYLNRQSWFNIRVAADDGFWRYLSLKVVPDLVAARWGKDNEDHYWKLTRRIWLKTLWWYVYLSWNENETVTKEIIGSRNCSTDTILNLTERSGKKGTCVDAYRNIINIYSRIPSSVLSEFNKKAKKDDLFRIVMKLNTARMMVMEPCLCFGGAEGYARRLFEDVGIKL